MLEIKNLSYFHNDKKIIEDVSLEVKKGISAILGRNGSGKSTLLALAGGYLQPQEGEILFEGKKVLGPDYKLIPGHPGIAVVRQDMRLTPYATVRENLEHILRHYEQSEINLKIEQLSELLGFSHFIEKTLKFLSGGEQQRISIAAALASYPKLLLLDEPFSQTDMMFKLQIKKYLKEINKQLGTSILFVTHDAMEAISLAEEIFILESGKIREKGDGGKLYSSPENFITAELTGICNWLNESLIPLSRNGKQVKEGFLVRPEKIKIEKEKTLSNIKAIVTDISLTGPFTIIEVKEIISGTKLLAIESYKEVYEAGQEVYISF